MRSYVSSRRSFLRSAAAGLTAASFAASPKRPNILFAIADDWSWPYASIAGDKAVKTPNFDRIAREGILFRHAYTVAPTCTASRGAALTGQWFARLEQGGNLWSTLPPKFDVYPDILERAGYHVGYTGKGWGPGDWAVSGRKRNPAGPVYSQRKLKPPTTGISPIDYTANFGDFLAKRGKDQPFCFWYGGIEPHRVYEEGSGRRAGKRPQDVRIPACLPDAPQVREDLMDYALEIEWFDTHLGRMVKMLEDAGELDNTMIVVTGDNGMPFPRCKANVYDCGTNVPLAIRWAGNQKPGRTPDDFVSLADLAPTFLEAAGQPVPASMTGRTLMNVLKSDKSGLVDPKRDHVFTGRERHTIAQAGSTAGYPMRALRTRDFVLIRNYEPQRSPAGTESGTSQPYRDIDAGLSKTYVVEHAKDPAVSNFFELSVGKRPAVELYDLRKDAGELRNVATDAAYAKTRTELQNQLDTQLKAWKDPRALGNGAVFDTYEYLGDRR
jgi:uncharacterized sulfatase